MLVVLVVSEGRASACLIMLSTKHGNHWYHNNAIVMARLGFEPPTSRSRSGRSTTEQSGPITLGKNLHETLTKVITFIK